MTVLYVVELYWIMKVKVETTHGRSEITLSLQFSQNLLKENKAYELHITDKVKLDGLPDTAREAAALAAKEKEVDGYLPSTSPVSVRL